jgi:hypothetical protein
LTASEKYEACAASTCDNDMPTILTTEAGITQWMPAPAEVEPKRQDRCLTAR